jgi:CRISPR-associated protein Csb2
MFALEVEYLLGRSVSSERSDRDSAEWPPHPGRLFSALVAAHAERDPDDEAEREALRWLERQPPPSLNASGASRRVVQTVYVPVNDTLGPGSVPRKGFTAKLVAEKIKVLPERRSKQPRTFPSVTPQSPRVVFIWPEADATEAAAHRLALERLAANMTYLGHSSSLVRAAICDDPPSPNLRPDDEGTCLLRVATAGRLDDLLATYLDGRRPSPGLYCSYAEVPESPSEETPSSTLGRLITFRIQGVGRLPLVAAPKRTAAVRDALMSLADQPPLEVLSGHAPDGSQSKRDHAAIFPLAFVGHRHADGSIKGFAVAVPEDMGADERIHVLRALGRLRGLTLGRDGAWAVERLVDEPTLRSLGVGPYVRPATTWATVTPMVFDRFPKAGPGRDARSLAAEACRRIGLPEPEDVEVSPVSLHRGVPTSPEFRLRPKPGVPPRPYHHVAIRFADAVRGPIALGAGRFLGMGLFRACDNSPSDEGGRR